jgi:hypothetical protein
MSKRIWHRIDKDTAERTVEDETYVLDRLRGVYADISLAISHAEAGHDLTTPFAIYQIERR